MVTVRKYIEAFKKLEEEGFGDCVVTTESGEEIAIVSCTDDDTNEPLGVFLVNNSEYQKYEDNTNVLIHEGGLDFSFDNAAPSCRFE